MVFFHGRNEWSYPANAGLNHATLINICLGFGKVKKEILPVKSKIEAQIWADVLLHEKHRHLDDINQIVKDLIELKKKWGVKPRGKYVNKWIKP